MIRYIKDLLLQQNYVTKIKKCSHQQKKSQLSNLLAKEYYINIYGSENTGGGEEKGGHI